ncbi:MAG: DUF6340 family protein, partial [Prolixibacteraceae bacterium]|nr:DUF6340 family protein [Prolixibacteraceae bacterium]
MRKLYFLLVLLFITIQLTAQLKKFQVEVPQAPKFKITDSIQSFTLLNRSLTPEFKNYNEDSLQVAFFRKNFDANLILLDSITSDTTLRVLGELLYDSDRFDIVIPVERNIPRNLSYIKTPSPLDWNYVEEMCDLYKTDALIVLENIATRVVTNYDLNKEYNAYSSYKTHYASIDFYYRAHWRIYYPKSKNIIVDFIMNQDTVFWDNFEYDLIELFKGLPSVKQASTETGIKIALEFSDIISPTWLQETRYYYVTKKAAIDKSIKLASEGNWEEALVNWNQYTNYGNSATRSKIMLNVALAYEMTGDLPNSIEWAQISSQKYYREVTNHYL